MEIGPFTVMQKMIDNGDERISLAPLGNIIAANKNGDRHTLVIGVNAKTFKDISEGVKFMGGLVLVPEDAFNEVLKTMQI